MRHFLSIKDFSKDEILEMLAIASDLKRALKSGSYTKPMAGKSLAMIFEKSSTRTRVSFEVGATQLGMHPLFLSSKDIQLGRGEPMKDTARVISRMVDMVMIRTFEHSRLEEFAHFSNVPVINGLSDDFHPVQLLADYMTIREHGLEKDLKVAWIGDGNNMANSWLMLASKLGFDLSIATPEGYEVDKRWADLAYEFAKKSGAVIEFSHDPYEAIKNASVVTTDVWTSMGQEAENEKRLKDFAGFTLDEKMMKGARSNAILLHCLPVHRGEEVSEELFEKHSNVIFDEAENRLHAQKGAMLWLNNQI